MTYQTKPSSEIIKTFVDKFPTKNFYDNENYLASIKLTNAFRSCDDYQNIYIKVNYINGAFKTTIGDTFGVAKIIYEKVKNIDERLLEGDIKLIDDIAHYKSKKTKAVRKNFSFATKFCHCHQPDLFPINDRYVRNSLVEFNKHHKFSKFTKKSLLDYKTFKEVLKEFKVFVNGDTLDFATIDRFLWALGRENEKRKTSQK